MSKITLFGFYIILQKINDCFRRLNEKAVLDRKEWLFGVLENIFVKKEMIGEYTLCSPFDNI